MQRHWKWWQQCGLKVVLAYVTNAQVNWIEADRNARFFILPRSSGQRAEVTLLFVCKSFRRTSQQPDLICCIKSTTNLFLNSILSRASSIYFWTYGTISTQHSSSPNLIGKVQDWRDGTYTDERARHRIRCIPPLLKCIPLCEPKRRVVARYTLQIVRSVARTCAFCVINYWVTSRKTWKLGVKCIIVGTKDYVTVPSAPVWGVSRY